MGYGIPVMIAINSALLLANLLVWRKFNLNYLIGLILSIPFISMSIGLNDADETTAVQSFNLLSYNAKLFRQHDTYGEFSAETIDWVVNHSADIKCIQEFSYNSDYDHLSVLEKAHQKGHYTYNFELNIIHSPGLAIISRYPMAQSGVIDIDSSSVNNIIFADIIIKSDTVRIYNVHLKSMRLELNSYKDLNTPRKDFKSVINKLRYGAINRSKQIDGLLAHASACAYPIVICGDFNETPYSFNYIRLRSHFNNSQEKAGTGLGLSYLNGPIRLRIDHHFYNEQLSVKNFRLDYKVRSSDHIPTIGTYFIEP